MSDEVPDPYAEEVLQRCAEDPEKRDQLHRLLALWRRTDAWRMRQEANSVAESLREESGAFLDLGESIAEKQSLYLRIESLIDLKTAAEEYLTFFKKWERTGHEMEQEQHGE